MVHGKCLTGPNLIAGEWGHNALPWPTPSEIPGPLCYCGKQSCIEAWLSGPSFEREHLAHTGNRRDARAIVDDAAQGEAAAQASLARYHERLGRALASVINVLDPDVIVLGGGCPTRPVLQTPHSPHLHHGYFRTRSARASSEEPRRLTRGN